MSVNDVEAGLWFLACDGNDIVGVALNACNKSRTVGIVDHLGVLRTYRKRGIGEALMLASFAAFYRRGMTSIKLNVEADSPTNAPRLYERLGMKTVQQYHIYTKSI
jgi:ribosomal protein S18 acetylase RimI-like enzyme